MGHEFHYETYMCGIGSDDLVRTLEENEEWKRKIEDEIFALIAMDPSKVRNQRRKSKKDDESEDDSSWMNNAQYIARLWSDLKEQWENAESHIIRCSQAKDAMRDPIREVQICKDCMRELEWRKKRVEDGEFGPHYDDVFVCPECHKEFATEPYEAQGENAKPVPAVVKIKTWSEG